MKGLFPRPIDDVSVWVGLFTWNTYQALTITPIRNDTLSFDIIQLHDKSAVPYDTLRNINYSPNFYWQTEQKLLFLSNYNLGGVGSINISCKIPMAKFLSTCVLMKSLLPRPINDLSVWVGLSTLSPHQYVKFQLRYLVGIYKYLLYNSQRQSSCPHGV
jgi:hypothetical protein